MKKGLCLLLVMLCSVSLFACGSSSDAEDKSEESTGTSKEVEEEPVSSDTAKGGEEWSDSDIASYMPKPDSEHIQVEQDDEDYFGFMVSDATQDDFDDYIGSCQYMGFTKDVEDDGRHYAAVSEDGQYEINITYNSSDESYDGYIVPKK